MTGGHSYLGCAHGKVYRPLGVSKICHSGQRLEVYHSVSKCILDTVDRILREYLDPAQTKNNGETHQNQGRWYQKKHLEKILAKTTNHETDVAMLLKKKTYMGVSENRGTPESSILIGFSIINHPFWGTPWVGKHPDFEWVAVLAGISKTLASTISATHQARYKTSKFSSMTLASKHQRKANRNVG